MAARTVTDSKTTTPEATSKKLPMVRDTGDKPRRRGRAKGVPQGALRKATQWGTRSPELAALGARLRELRFARGLTQENLAKRIRMNLNHYRRLEHGDGNPTLRVLLRLSGGLETPLEELLKDYCGDYYLYALFP